LRPFLNTHDKFASVKQPTANGPLLSCLANWANKWFFQERRATKGSFTLADIRQWSAPLVTSGTSDISFWSR
jgi:hypothetical protein